MTTALRLTLLFGIIIYLFSVFYMLKKGKFILKYALIWFASAVVLLIFDIFPGIVVFFSSLLGFQTASNAVFILIIAFILLVLLSLTSIVSKQHDDIKRLIQTVSVLEKKVEELNK